MISQVTEDAAKMVQYILSPFGVNFKEMLKTYQQSSKSSDAQEQEEKWLTLKAAVAYAKVSKWTIMRWRNKGLKVIKTSHAKTSRIIISKDSLDAILESLCISGPEAKQ